MSAVDDPRDQLEQRAAAKADEVYADDDRHGRKGTAALGVAGVLEVLADVAGDGNGHDAHDHEDGEHPDTEVLAGVVAAEVAVVEGGLDVGEVHAEDPTHTGGQDEDGDGQLLAGAYGSGGSRVGHGVSRFLSDETGDGGINTRTRHVLIAPSQLLAPSQGTVSHET